MIIRNFENEKSAIRAFFSKSIPNFVGIGFGSADEVSAIQVFVKSMGKGDYPASYTLTDGRQVRVGYSAVGEIKLTGFTGRYRPAQPGAVIGGDGSPYAGTFGALVTDNTDGSKVILSCNHVLANWSTLPVGTAILQPSSAFGGTNPADKIGTLKRSVVPDFNPYGVNYVDAAIASRTNSSVASQTPFCSSVKPTKQGAVGMVWAASPYITIINPISFLLSQLNISVPKQKTATVGMSIHACTAASGYVTTTVSAVMVDLLLMAENGNEVWFMDQITCTGGILDGLGGDSGAMFYTTFNV
jgi:hypothetical protein